MKNEESTLIIAEKPDAALRIAQALDEKGKPKKKMEKKVPFFEAQRDGEKLIVVPALGHLYTVTQEMGRRNFYPVFNYKWAPRHAAEKGAKQVEKWIKVISDLAKNIDDFVNACDYDIEGSLIGYMVLKYACNNSEDKSKRMKYSTLMKRELEHAYQNLMPHLDFPLVEAGRARHEVDWLYGVNLSRALTIAAANWSKWYSTLSTGRVQGPTLKFLVEREKEIQSYVPIPYWSIKAVVDINGSPYEVAFEKEKIDTKREADDVVKKCAGKKGTIKDISLKEFRQMPPIPFDIGGLQAEVYRLFGFTPSRTLRIAERLYLEAMISYPRTSSQKLPPIINYNEILTSLSKREDYRKLASELLAQKTLQPNEGRKEDPAHPAIYPTGLIAERPLDESEQKLYDLVVRRFMAVFGEPALKQTMNIAIDVEGYLFHLYGRRVLESGWLKFYEQLVKSDEVLLPTLEVGQKIPFKEVAREDKFINPPPRYNPSSLLKLMEEQSIGTKATRAEIIDTLYDRNYIQDERMLVTDLGFHVIDTLERYCPDVISVELTRELEERMEKIEVGKESREVVLDDAITKLKPILDEFKQKEKEIGKELNEAIRKARAQERTVGPCPICGSGNLIILRSRRTGKQFIGCSNYFKNLCKAGFPLPQRATVKPLRRNCSSCQWPMVHVRIFGGRRPWNLCFNPNCPARKEREANAVRNMRSKD